MIQTSFFSDGPFFPSSYDDVLNLYQTYIFEGETDEDVFTWSDTKNGRSYFMYGKKVLEFIPGDAKKARLRVYFPDKDTKPDILTSDAYPSTILNALCQLKEIKKKLFRNTITEEFACCNDFLKCSDAKQCLYPQDRFYNGCYYRKNLEAGRIFYGKNKNID